MSVSQRCLGPSAADCSTSPTNFVQMNWAYDWRLRAGETAHTAAPYSPYSRSLQPLQPLITPISRPFSRSLKPIQPLFTVHPVGPYSLQPRQLFTTQTAAFCSPYSRSLQPIQPLFTAHIAALYRIFIHPLQNKQPLITALQIRLQSYIQPLFIAQQTNLQPYSHCFSRIIRVYCKTTAVK